ncbi:MAG TPA: DNA polymerase III subunit gamma/tau [Saprospiraceae bacterium]|nr:DNA polymerase III subunit gamma/tau [Saprospiraceae bacterium]HUN17048.1 DNA polymerase III subunit gamma/tau [Saprospiraceae bacterium]
MENFLVSARKYRPLRWIDVAGQDHVTNTLKSALQQGQVAHAFLFTGPRGVGKTTCARILARVLNCSNPTAEWEPCNTCEMCVAFQENASFNIFELDAASNNGVEHIRNLVEQVRYQPQYGKYKIYIIDEVHMLSSAAFNAFLKTLEEPPPFAKFILATTEKHKILPTILSRCQVYDFKRIKEKDIVANLEKIAAQEKIKADNDALYLIAQKADGGMRDALSIFDRITSYSGATLSYEDAVINLNVLDQDYYFKFIDAFLKEDIQSAFLLYDQVLSSGFDPEIFLEGMGSHLRNLLVSKHPQMQQLYEGSDGWKQKYLEQANAVGLGFMMTALDMLNEAEVNLIRAKNRRLHIEVLLGKLCFLNRRKTTSAGLVNETNDEKKNPELNIVNADIKPVGESPKSDDKENLVQAESKKNNDIVKSNTSEEMPPIVNSQTPSQSKQSPVTAIPKLLDLNKIKEKIQIEEKQKKENLLELKQESFLIFWNQLIAEQKSNSLRMFMSQAEITVTQQNIAIKVGSAMSREALRHDLKLDERIRMSFREENVIATIEVDSAMAEREEKSQTKRLYSGKEKWEMLVEANPKLAELKEKLELTIDEY